MNYHIIQMSDSTKRDRATAAFARAASASKKKAPGLSLKAREHAFSSSCELASQFYEPGVVYTFDYFDSFFRADCFHLDLKVCPGSVNGVLYGFSNWRFLKVNFCMDCYLSFIVSVIELTFIFFDFLTFGR